MKMKNKPSRSRFRSRAHSRRVMRLTSLSLCAALAAGSFVPAAAAGNIRRDTEAGSVRTITLTENTEEALEIMADETVILDLNGFTLTSPADKTYAVSNAGELTVTDSSEAGGGSIKKDGSSGESVSGVLNSGALTIDGGIIETSTAADCIAYGVYMNEGSSFTMLSGNISAKTTGSKWAIGVYNAAGTIKDVSGGEISGTIKNVSNPNNALGISNEAGAKIEKISGGSIKAYTNTSGVAYGVRNRGSVALISGGDIYGYSNGSGWTFAFYNTDTGTVDEISGGKFYGEFANVSSGNNGLGISNEGVISLISGGLFTASVRGSGSSYGIRTDKEITEITGGAFCGNNTSNSLYRRGGTMTFGAQSKITSYTTSGARYVIPKTGKYVELAGEDGKFYAAYSFDENGALVNAFGLSLPESHTVYIKNEGKLTATEMTVSDLAKLSGSQTLYAKTQPEEKPTLYFLGSSVTYGHTTGGVSFVENLAKLNDWNCVKRAVSGTTLVLGTDSYISRMKNQIGQNAKIDCFTCQLSTNDASQNKPLGSISDGKNLNDFKTTTIIGAIEYIVCYVRQTWNCPVVFYTNPRYDSAPYLDMVNALYELQKKWDFEIIDFYNYKDMPALSDSVLNSYMSDSIHPNSSGYKWMANIMSDRYKEILAPKQPDPKPDPKPADVSGVSVSKKTLKLTVGSAASLSASVTPAGFKAAWRSSDSKVASVNAATGKITAKAPGKATITAFAGQKSASCTVTVRPGKIKTLRVKRSGGGSVKIKFSKSAGGGKYQIFMKKGKGKYKLIKTTVRRTFVKSKLSRKKAYSFKVRSFKAAGGKRYYSDHSKAVSVKL